MKQEQAAGKILLELMSLGIVKGEENEQIVYTYLTQCYAVGHDEGSKARSNKRPVAQLSLDGKLLNIFDSAAEASRRTGIQHSDIAKTASGKKDKKGHKYHTAGGFKWKYIDTTKPIASETETETIRSYRPGSNQPK